MVSFIRCAVVFITLIVVGNAFQTPDPNQFEAAFQGRCGFGSPCSQLCRELHDGTFECGCNDGFVLNLDGYSCQEMNLTTKASETTFDYEDEDIIYQKGTIFSAKLDTTNEIDNELTNHFNKNFNSNESEIDKLNNEFDKAIKNYDIKNPMHTFTHPSGDNEHRNEIDNTDISNNVIKKMKSAKIGVNYIIDGEMFKEMKGISGLIGDGLSHDDISMISDGSIDLTSIVTTLGPSLEQKLPPYVQSTVVGYTASITKCNKRSSEGCLVCPVGKSGPGCGREMSSWPRFTGSSYLALPALRGAYKRVRLRVRVRPDTVNAVILLTGERDDLDGDYFALIFIDGHLELRFDCGSGSGVIRSSEKLRLGEWNEVSVYRHRWDAWIRLNNGKRTRGRSKGLFSRMTFREPVWIGGGGNISTHALKQRLDLNTGLVGCIADLHINGKTYNLMRDALAGADIAECAPTLPNFIQDSRSTDATFTQISTHKNQAVRMTSASFMKITKLSGFQEDILNIKLSVRATCSSGVILQATRVGKSLALYVKDYKLQLIYDGVDGRMTIRSPRHFSLNTWHIVCVTIEKSKQKLRVCQPQSNNKCCHTINKYQNVSKDKSFTDLTFGYDEIGTIDKIPVNISMEGCLKNVSLNGRIIDLNTTLSNEEQRGHIELCNSDCIINECLDDISDEKIPNYYEDRHKINETHDSVVPKKYHRHTKGDDKYLIGEIRNELVTESNYEYNHKSRRREVYMRVKSLDNWISTPVYYPSFMGTDSYIHMDDTQTIKRIVNTRLDINLRLRADPVKGASGLVIWAGVKGHSTFILYLRDGYLSMRYDIESKGTVSIDANHTRLDDGVWHRIRATRSRIFGVLAVDGHSTVGRVIDHTTRDNNTRTNYMSLMQTQADGVYLGGVPSVKSESNGLIGCISHLTINYLDVPLTLNELPHTITSNVNTCTDSR